MTSRAKALDQPTRPACSRSRQIISRPAATTSSAPGHSRSNGASSKNRPAKGEGKGDAEIFQWRQIAGSGAAISGDQTEHGTAAEPAHGDQPQPILRTGDWHETAAEQHESRRPDQRSAGAIKIDQGAWHITVKALHGDVGTGVAEGRAKRNRAWRLNTSAPGRMIRTTPAKPMTTADQRHAPTR